MRLGQLEFGLWTSFAAFASSAARGCHTCTLLYESVHEPYKSRLETAALYLESSLIKDSDGRQVVLTADLTTIGKHADPREAELANRNSLADFTRMTPIALVKFVLDDKLVDSNARHYKGLISLYAEDDGALRYIQQSLHTCLAKHRAICDRVVFPLSGTATQRENHTNIVMGDRGSVVAPTRLIYVGSGDAKDPPRLVPGKECLYKGGYIVLSYCWGLTPRHAPWQLTTLTQESFAGEIPMSVLPQTLHDALLWTRQMGERYIWIDSMCIIQDSSQDTQREIARMASIYGSATMTFVAASSSVYGGMSDRRNPLRNSAAGLQLSHKTKECTVYILPNGQRRQTPLPPPTESRGWCYQEDLLSARLVKLTPKSVVWQCLGDGSNPPIRAQGDAQITKLPTFRGYTVWYRIVERYSNRQLSFPADKLPGFHGIAMHKLGSDYVAGCRRSDPWASLLWCRDENQVRRRPGTRYESYVAPSWSWASLDVPILFYEANSRHWRDPQLEPVQYDPELHSITVENASYFDTGAVKAGSIDFSAHMAFVRTAPSEPYLFNTSLGPHTRGRRNLCDLSSNALPVGLVVFDVATEAKDGAVLLCALLHVANTGLWQKNGTCGLGLALRLHAVTPEGVLYTRVGYVQFTSAFAKLSERRRIKVV